MPIIKKAFVDKKHLLEEKDMLDMIALAQSLPGVMAVNASMLYSSSLFFIQLFKPIRSS